MAVTRVRSDLNRSRFGGAALVVVGVVAGSGCTQEQSDAVADDFARVLLYFVLFALVIALVVVALVALAGGMIAKGLHGLRNPPPPPAAPQPGQPAPPPDRSSAWGTLIAGTVLAALVLPIAFQIFDYSISSALISALPVALVVGAVLLIRRGPPRSAPSTVPLAPPAPFAYPPPPPPPPPPARQPPAPSPSQPQPLPPGAPPRRRAPLRAPGREAGTHPPRKRN